MTSAALHLVPTEDDIYVAEPAATPRHRGWTEEAERVDLFALIPRRNVHRDPAPSSGVRLREATVMDLEGMR